MNDIINRAGVSIRQAEDAALTLTSSASRDCLPADAADFIMKRLVQRLLAAALGNEGCQLLLVASIVSLQACNQPQMLMRNVHGVGVGSTKTALSWNCRLNNETHANAFPEDGSVGALAQQCSAEDF